MSLRFHCQYCAYAVLSFLSFIFCIFVLLSCFFYLLFFFIIFILCFKAAQRTGTGVDFHAMQQRQRVAAQRVHRE